MQAIACMSSGGRELVRRLGDVPLEGALPIELLRTVRPDVDLSSWESEFKFDGFEHFLGDLLDKQVAWFTSVERYQTAASCLFRRQLAANVRYVELSVASGALEQADLNGREVLAAVAAAAPPGLDVRVFLGIHHDGNTPRMSPTLVECVAWPELSGIDLHGSEGVPLEPWTAPLWRAARQHGKLCPISNHRLLPGVQLDNHPIRELFGAGVTITLSTDDPVMFGNTVSDDCWPTLRRRAQFVAAS